MDNTTDQLPKDNEPSGKQASITTSAPRKRRGAAPTVDPKPVVGGVEFSTRRDAPFLDRYDIDAERARLLDLIEADNPDSGDPRFPAYLEYLERAEKVEQDVKVYRQRGGAESGVSDLEAAAINKLSGLVPTDSEFMVIHTKESYRAFTGRSRAPDGHFDRIVGGRKAAASLKALYFLTGNDNPYADWALVSITEQMIDLDKLFDDEISRYERVIRKRAEQGLVYSILKSKEPQKVELGFRSPYGFKVAELLVRYDYLIRLVKTFNYRSLLTDAEASKISYGLTKKMRRLFLAPLRFEAILLRDDVAQLCRQDFLAGATIEGQQRVGKLMAIFGIVPTNVMTGEVVPQYGKNRTVLAKEDLAQLRALQAVPIESDGVDGAERELL
jgi:integrating conjugative element protein (TIGR03761 family)